MRQIFTTIQEALEDIKDGKFVIVVDDEKRENEGDLVLAAEHATAEKINFMTKYGRGLVCVAMRGERLDELNIGAMVVDGDPTEAAFAVSVDYKHGTTTGISAYDRAKTIRALVNKKTKPQDFRKPGHVFPLRAHPGGVLVRSGHTEAAVDLASLAGLYPAGVICEIMREDGRMARLNYLAKFAAKHNIKIISIAQLINYRHKNERLIERIAETHLPTRFGEFKLIAYRSIIETNKVHLALVLGDISTEDSVLVRVHSQCLTGEVFGSLRCDCGQQVNLALERIRANGSGVFLYMAQEGRDIGLINKLRAYELQDKKGLDTAQANLHLNFKEDLRDYGLGAQILKDLGLSKLKLLTNNPRKIVGLKGYGLEIIERIPLEVIPSTENIRYLKTKKEKFGHLLNNVC